MRDGCTGKNKYSKNKAEVMKAVIGRGRRKSVRIYNCPKCHSWHLTKRDSPR